jgi:hypothetical protein
MKANCLTDDEVIEKARWLLDNGTTVRTSHFEQELVAANATMQDVICVFLGKCKVEGRRWDSRRKSYAYKLSGSDEDGEILNIVVAFNFKHSKLILITAI